MCLIQIKCIDFNSMQFNTFGVEFDAIHSNSMCFRIASNSAIRRLFELRQIDVKKALNCIELSSAQFNAYIPPIKNFSAGKVLTGSSHIIAKTIICIEQL